MTRIIKESSQVNKEKSGDASKEYEPLTATEKNATHWNANKTASVSIAQMYQEQNWEKYAELIGDCASYLEFQRSVVCETGEVVQRLSTVYFCKKRWCPVCQWRKSLLWVARFNAALPKIEEMYPKGRWVFVTFTVKNCDVEELKATLRWMNVSWRKLISRTGWPALGFVRSVEVTRNSETGQVHPHFHALLLVPSSYFGRDYRKHEWWVSQWRSALQVDYDPMVNVKASKGQKGYSDAQSAAVEVLKYAVKPSDLMSDADFLCQLTEQMHGSRSLSTGGVLKDIVKEEASAEELRKLEEKAREETEEELDTVKYFYHHGFQQYVC